MGSRGQRASLSIGTILMLCLTVAVIVGCVIMFGKILRENPDASMGAQKAMDLVGSALLGSTPEPSGQQSLENIWTVTVAPRSRATALPTTAPGSRPTPAPANGQRASFSLTAGGLLGFHSDISSSVYDANAKTFDFSQIGAPLNNWITADLNLAALPQGINTEDLIYGDYLAPAAVGSAIRCMGFTHVLLSTEHVLDQGASGAQQTVNALKAQRLTPLGVNAADCAQNTVINVNGAKVALITYTDVLTAKSQNTLAQEPYLLRMYSQDIARQDIQAARAQGASCVIVCMYWGRPDTTTPSTAQKNTARALAQMGADVVLGFRPNRVLPVEILGTQNENGNYHETLVAYSLGTLLTESREGYDISGILLHIGVNIDEWGQVTFRALEYTPTYIWRQSVDGRMTYRVVNSASAIPDGMNSDQQRYMQNALNRIRDTLKNCPVSLRQ